MALNSDVASGEGQKRHSSFQKRQKKMHEVHENSFPELQTHLFLLPTPLMISAAERISLFFKKSDRDKVGQVQDSEELFRVKSGTG